MVYSIYIFLLKLILVDIFFGFSNSLLLISLSFLSEVFIITILSWNVSCITENYSRKNFLNHSLCCWFAKTYYTKCFRFTKKKINLYIQLPKLKLLQIKVWKKRKEKLKLWVFYQHILWFISYQSFNLW